MQLAEGESNCPFHYTEIAESITRFCPNLGIMILVIITIIFEVEDNLFEDINMNSYECHFRTKT